MYLVPVKFRKGDLVELNHFGRIMLVDRNHGKVGVIMSDARNCELRMFPEEHMYWVYDVFVGNELITGIPQDFMRGIYEDESTQDCE